jgi:uncharacterized protein (DUF1697 family)
LTNNDGKRVPAATATRGTGRFIALLRGINVSGHNPLAMADLRGLLETLPAGDVATYLQSGNAVFSTEAADPEALAGAIAGRIRSETGMEVTVLVRTAEDWARVAGSNPFLAGHPEGDVSRRLLVTFLSQAPDDDRVAALTSAADAYAPDTFRVMGREVYLSCPNGYGRTKLNNSFFEKKVATPATTRNWRTVTALAEMTR